MYLAFAVPLTLFLYCPIMAIVCALTPWKGFKTATSRRRRQRYTTLHLSARARIGHLSRRRATRLHRSFLTTLHRALQNDTTPVYFTSHLMRPAHRKSMTALLTSLKGTHRWRCIPVPVSRRVRTGITLLTFMQEWRRINVPDTGVLVVIRPVRKGR